MNPAAMTSAVDHPSPSDEVSKSERQIAVLERHLPEGYSADADASLRVSNHGDDSDLDPDVVVDHSTVSVSTRKQPSDETSLLQQKCPDTTSESLLAQGTNLSGLILGDATEESMDLNSPTTSPNDHNEDSSLLESSLIQEPLESSLKLQGGDIHRDMFKIKARANSIRRANTFSHGPSPLLQPEDDLSYADQREPGGFRRHFVRHNYKARHRRASGPLIVANTFVDFLDLYGSFAGEDLEDTDSDEESSSAVDDAEAEEGLDETASLLVRRPKLGQRKSTRRHMARVGDAGTVKTFFTLLKAFIGTGIMFLPKAFRNGGILFSSMVLIVVSIVSCFCFRLLLDCRQKHGGSYGELGAQIVGSRFRSLILASIALSQLGFVCAGLIFTAENLWAFLDAVTPGKHNLGLGVPSLIAIQLIPLIPLALIRHISKLGPVAMAADVFILGGIFYIWYYDLNALFTRGMDPGVKLFNHSSWTLTIGSAIFTFEGIGLILPIQSSMAEPEHFRYLLYFVMLLITIIFTSVGALCYATFGEDTKIQVITNFPQDSPLVNAVQFLYSLAVLAGEPVQLFPAVRILETTLFGELASGAKSAAVKWKKNAVRALTMALCVTVSIVGATDLDKFVSLIGSFACVPLVYIYPAYLHYHGVAESLLAKTMDLVLMVIGAIAMVYTTAMAIKQWVEG